MGAIKVRKMVGDWRRRKPRTIQHKRRLLCILDHIFASKYESVCDEFVMRLSGQKYIYNVMEKAIAGTGWAMREMDNSSNMGEASPALAMWYVLSMDLSV